MSYYSVIRYVPGLIADERINIGVIAFDDQRTQVKFLSNWDRVNHFARTFDEPFLLGFRTEMLQAAGAGLLFPGDRPGKLSKYRRMVNVSRRWANSIQFSEPRGCLEDVDELLASAAKDYLIEPIPGAAKAS